MKHYGFAALLVLTLVGILVFLYQDKQPDPELTFRIIDGQTLTLGQYRGNPVLIDFWATTCPSCMQELPDLITLYEELSGRGLQIIGVAMPYDRPDFVLKTTQEKNIPYPIALDINGEINAAFGQIQVTPTHFLIGPDGKIFERIVGAIDPPVLRDKIEAMLQKKSI